MILAKIVSKKREEVAVAKDLVPVGVLKERLKAVKRPAGGFAKSVSRPGHINLIAEIKKSSPSKGVIRQDFHPLAIAAEYEAAGASAISVLTDESFFGGKLEYLVNVKSGAGVPILRKDFIIDEYQVYESAAAGADAILLIARILTQEEMAGYISMARTYGMDALVETHNEEELEKALKSGADIIGINNRDLSSFAVDLSTTERLVRLVPAGKITVAESGIENNEQVLFLKSLGVNAILVGETLMRAKDIIRKTRELLGHNA
jgi:indole-3-glycerol phosphate synthase